MGNFPAYENYRAADISWLSSVPSHWRTTRLKREAQIQTGVTLGKVYAGEVESRPYLRVANVQAGFLDLSRVKSIEVPRSEALKSELRPNDVVLTEGGDIDKLGRGAIWSGQIKGCIHQNHVFAVRPDQTTLSSKFLTYILESPHGRSYFQVTAKQTTNLAATNRSTLGRLPLFLPPRDEQDQIVAYLRAQDAHIARYILAKRELIKLLTERKLAIIDRAVTRGLDPNVRLKPSGIEWLGEVPEHWEALKLKFATKRIVGGSTPKSDNPSYWDGGIVWVTPRDISKTDSLHTSLRTISEAGLHSCAATLVPPGSIVITSRAPVGNVAIARVELCTNQGCKAVVPAQDIAISDYLFLLLLRMRERLQVLANGTTFAEIGTWALANEFIPVPPVSEQQTICRWIADECQPLDDAIARAEEEIQLIREYRDRLIADVVTGQIDVRGWRPGPDDVASDEELAALGDDEVDLSEEKPSDDGE